MTNQSANPKIQPLLASLLSHHNSNGAENAPQVQVIIQLESEALAEHVLCAIEENGGEVIMFNNVYVESRIPGTAVGQIAALDSVVNIRLARLPTPSG